MRKKVSVLLAMAMLVSGISSYGAVDVVASSNKSASVKYETNKKTNNSKNKSVEKETTTQSTEMVTEVQTTEKETTTEVQTTEKETTTEAQTTEKETTIEIETTTVAEATTEVIEIETENEKIESETVYYIEETKENVIEEETTEEKIIEEETTEVETTENETEEIDEEIKEETVYAGIEGVQAKEEIVEETIVVVDNAEIESEINSEIYEKLNHYEELAAGETEWLWSQQLSNGAFAFYNASNGQIYINVYFGEEVAIALINHDSSDLAKERIEKYLDWHFAHINSAEEDYNGLAGTIYDYDVTVRNNQVVEEVSKESYDSTDSYAALFLKILADYVKVYGDTTYIKQHEGQIKDVTNVIFATMLSTGYTYAKPDYKICYLMDNTEVYAGLIGAEYLYKNIIDDKEMETKVSVAVKHYEENFVNDWWKGDHYAVTMNKYYKEDTLFSWDNFYPCATAQIFPVIYGLASSDSETSKIVNDGLNSAWDWQNMDYVTKGISVFYWCNFAMYAAEMNDIEGMDSFMAKYQEVIDGGRKYPLYGAESAMVLIGCDKMIANLKNS